MLQPNYSDIKELFSLVDVDIVATDTPINSRDDTTHVRGLQIVSETRRPLGVVMCHEEHNG